MRRGLSGMGYLGVIWDTYQPVQMGWAIWDTHQPVQMG